VFRFDENLKVYVHRDAVDFRYGMNSLSILVEQSMRLNPMEDRDPFHRAVALAP